jgi:hypothetical protein
MRLARERIAAPNGNLAAVAGLEILFPVCRSVLLERGTDPTPLRIALDRNTSLRHVSSDLSGLAADLGLTEADEAGRLFLEFAGREPPATLHDVIDAILSMAKRKARSEGQQLEEAALSAPASATQQLEIFRSNIRESSRSLSALRTGAAIVGDSLDQELFAVDANGHGFAVHVAVELDAARRLLPWFDRFDKRERRHARAVLREALAVGWDLVAGVDRAADASRLDRRLQQEFVDTDRFPPRDWIAWLAGRAVDATYSALGVAFGKVPFRPATADARSAARDVAAIGRGIDPSDLDRVYRTLVDAPVLDELRAQISGLRQAQDNPLSLRELTT